MSFSHKIASGKSMTFKRSPTTRSILDYADENRNMGRFCDVTINIENQCLPANKIILAYFSKYFESMFVTEMSEKYQNAVKIKGFDSVAVKLIIDYFYTGSIIINSDNVLRILAVADYIQVDDVKGFCFELLESELTFLNCLDIISAYNLYKPEESLNHTYQFLSENLSEISLEENFKALSKDEVKLIMANLDRNILKESSKYIAIMNWIKHDVETRKVDLTEMFQSIDLFQVEDEFLEDVIATDPLIKENKAVINTVLECHVICCKKMKLRSSGPKILCIGGNERGLVAEIRNIFTKFKCDYPDLPLNVSRHGALCVSQTTYCIGGGIEEGSHTKRVFQLNLRDSELQWKEVASLEATRSHFGAAVYDGCLIVAGGYRNGTGSRTDSVELFEVQTNTWKRISSLNYARSSNSVVSCCNGIFALGGYDDQDLPSVERLSRLNGKWELVAPMQIPRSCLAAVYCNGFIYAIGGTSGNSTEKSVEKYDLDENQWRKVASMNIERCIHSACVLHGKIIVVGGWNAADQPVREIECYDPVSDAWSIVGRTEYDFAGHSLVVV